jgi:FkbM family methyltransferase
MTLVDIGAHLGYFSLLAAKKVGSTGHVYAFEPQHDNCEMLGKSVLSNEFQNRVTIVEKAVTDCIGSVDLYYAEPGDGEASIYGRNAEGKDVHRLVETITLDEFFAAEGWPKVDIIKMDIEGAEKLALEGGRELIRRNPQLKMVMEFGPDVQAAAGVSPEELINTLLGVGFTQFSIIESELKPLNMPQDIPLLVETAGGGYVNLLCER